MLDFGKHAIFIWAAYGLSALVLGGLVVTALKRNKHD
ncbi:MAG: heme exporter protein CcmD [Alphaproteobacteria bacterium]